MTFDDPVAFSVGVLSLPCHPGQQKLLRAMSQSKTVVAACGRRWGKSTAAAISLLHFALKHPGSRQLVCAPTNDQTNIVFDAVVALSQRTKLISELCDKPTWAPFPELTIFAGNVRSRILCRSDASSIRGHGADRVICDEAAFIDERVMRQTLPPVLAASRIGYLHMLGTPFGMSGPMWEAFSRGDRDVNVFQFPSADNPWLSRETLAEQKEVMPELAYAVEYLAQWMDETEMVFRREYVEQAIDDDINSQPQAGERFVLGFDPAKYSDRSGCVVVRVPQTDHDPIVTVSVRDLRGRDYLTQAGLVEALAEQYNGARVVLDSTGHEQMREELERRGLKVEAVRFTNLEKHELIDRLAVAFEKGRMRIPNDERLLQELFYYRFELTSSGNVKLGAAAGKHDDLVTALALAVKGAARTQVVVSPAMMTRPSPWASLSSSDPYTVENPYDG